MKGTEPSGEQSAHSIFYRDVIGKVRETQPQIALSGEGWKSWDDVIAMNAQLGGSRGTHETAFHAATQQAAH